MTLNCSPLHRIQSITPIVLLILFCCSSAMAGDADSPEAPVVSPMDIEGVNKVDAEGLIMTVENVTHLTIIDARISSDRGEGYIEDSISLPDLDTDCDSLAEHVPATESPILFYCNGPKCGRSAKSSRIAMDCGYTNIYWFRGGIEEWKNKSYPLQR